MGAATVPDEPRAIAYVNMGYWVAKCPRPWCINVEWFGPGPNTGRVGGLGREGFTCLRCELRCASDWPDFADEIWRLLERRPQIETRNWEPSETPADLLAENATHGLLDVGELGRSILMVDNRLTDAGRQLVPAPDRQLLAIGGN
jgi:hypothetical protein